MNRFDRGKLNKKLIKLGTRYFNASSALSNVANTNSTNNVTIPRHSEVVICGGGVVGASVAYHLAARGLTDVVLLEQGRLSGGTTWHAAGLVGSMRSGVSRDLTAYSRNLYKWMEKNNYPTGFKQCGSINIATTAERLIDMKKVADGCRARKMEIVELSPKEVAEKYPWINCSDIHGGFWVPEDGAASPSDICLSLTKMAKDKGVNVIENCRVERVLTNKDLAVKGVETTAGIIHCDKFILCGGMWSKYLAAKTTPKVHVPLQPTEHFYLVTKPMAGFDPMSPVIRDADLAMYGREWSGGYLVGVFEENSLPVFPDGPPPDFQFQLFNENWSHFQKYFEPIFKRLPFLENTEIRLMTNGPESFTPDNLLIIGETPEVNNFYVATGMNSSGIALAGGVGRTISEIIIDGSPSVDCSAFDIKRYFPHQTSKDYLWNRGHEIVGKIYTLRHPKQDQYKTGRYVQLSPLYGQHKWRGAIFGAINQFEVPLWYPKCHQEINLKGTFKKPFWFDAVEEEVTESKTGLVVADVTGLWGSLTISCSGNSASSALEKLFYHDTRLPIGSLVQTGMLNSNGQYITECLLLSISNARYMLIYPLATQTRLLHWLNNKFLNQNASVTDTSGDYAFMMLLGPKTNQALKNLNANPTQPGMFNVSSYENKKEMLLLQHPLLPNGNTFGCVPKAIALPTYEALLAESARPIGIHALDALRLDEGIPWWGHDVTSGQTPLTAGKAPEVLNQTKPFIGKSALTKGSGSQRLQGLFHFSVPECDVHKDNWLWGGEPIFMGKSCVGSISSVAYSFHKRAFVGLGRVEKRSLESNADQMQVINAGTYYDLNILKVI